MKHRTAVYVDGKLANGRRFAYGWTTPVAFGRALSKGGAWARRELRTERVPGRSRIEELTVTVKRYSGD